MQSLLTCPYCQNSLSFKSLKSQRPTDKESWGIAKCSCDEYPIIEGILFLQKNDQLTNRRAVSLLKQGKELRAVWECLSVNSAKTHRLIVSCAYLSEKYLRLTPPVHFLLKTLMIVGPSRAWFDYLLNREKRGDIHLATKLVQERKKSNGLIVDVGFGTGNFYRLLTKKSQYPFGEYIGIDKSFLSLLIARVYIKKNNLLLVCCDVDCGIPVKKNTLSHVLFLDTFCLLHKKDFAIHETHRILKKGGTFNIINIYETAPKTYYWGYGIKAKELYSLLRNLFKNIKFMDNSLNSEGSIIYSPPIRVPRDGYSVKARKK